MHMGVETWLDDILDAISKRIVSKGGFTSDRVFDTLASDEDHCQFPPADQFVTITPQRFPVDQGTFSGAGRYLMGFNGTIRVAVLARFSVDQELRDVRVLRDKTRGILRAFLRVLDALAGYNPPAPQPPPANDGFSVSYADGRSACILREPMRPDGFDIQPRRVKQGSPWVVVASTWQVKFSAAMPSGDTPAGT